MTEERKGSGSVELVIDPEKCRLSGECMKVCPHGAISAGSDSAVIDLDKCDLDGICIPVCPTGAIDFSE